MDGREEITRSISLFSKFPTRGIILPTRMINYVYSDKNLTRHFLWKCYCIFWVEKVPEDRGSFLRSVYKFLARTVRSNNPEDGIRQKGARLHCIITLNTHIKMASVLLLSAM